MIQESITKETKLILSARESFRIASPDQRYDISDALKSGNVAFEELTGKYRSRANLMKAKIEELTNKKKEIVKTENQIKSLTLKIDTILDKKNNDE